MTELAPGWPLVVEETTANHSVATCGDVVLVFAYDGSHSDVQHVDTGTRVIERISRQRKQAARLLFVLPEGHAKPPSGQVRRALLGAGRRLEERLSKACFVVPGSGFGAAIHRGALTGIVALVRPRAPFLVTSNLRDALGYLLGTEEQVLAPLLRFCEAQRADRSPSKRA